MLEKKLCYFRAWITSVESLLFRRDFFFFQFGLRTNGVYNIEVNLLLLIARLQHSRQATEFISQIRDIKINKCYITEIKLGSESLKAHSAFK